MEMQSSRSISIDGVTESAEVEDRIFFAGKKVISVYIFFV
jgi:hypothetical protein